MKITGFGIGQMRIFSSLLAIPMLFSWWYIVRSLSRSVGLAMFAVGLIALDSYTIRAMHSGRPEMLGATLAATATAVYLRFRVERPHVAFALSAGLITASFLAHPRTPLSLSLLSFWCVCHGPFTSRRIRKSSPLSGVRIYKGAFSEETFWTSWRMMSQGVT
jgi:hypothetical protein